MTQPQLKEDEVYALMGSGRNDAYSAAHRGDTAEAIQFLRRVMLWEEYMANEFATEEDEDV